MYALLVVIVDDPRLLPMLSGSHFLLRLVLQLLLLFLLFLLLLINLVRLIINYILGLSGCRINADAWDFFSKNVIILLIINGWWRRGKPGPREFLPCLPLIP